MRTLTLIAFLALAWIAAPRAHASQAQPVPVPEDRSLTPQVEFSGVGIATLFAKRSNAGIDFSDSALSVGAAQRLADGSSIGSAGLGWLTMNETNRGTGNQFFVNQGFLDFQGERFEALIGRSDNPTSHLVDFPVLREENLITLTNPLNPFSNGRNNEEHRYSNVVSVTLNQGLTYFENFHVQHLIDSAGIGTDTGINAFGATFEYLSTPGMEAFQRFTSFGFGFEHFIVDSASSQGLNQAFAGAVMNLNNSVTNRVDLRVQDILSLGSDLNGFQSSTETYQANSNTIAAALRYLNSPFGSPGYQLALTGAFKNYFRVDRANSIGMAWTGVKRLGQGFDLVAQYQGQWRESSLAAAQFEGHPFEQTFEIGFIFNFNATLNQHLAPRRTILNQQYQYVPN